MFSQRNMPYILIATGILLNAIDIAAGTPTSGGRLFGPSGLLKTVNDLLPKVTIPGTKGISSVYPEGLPLSLGGWMVVAGIIWLVIRKV